MMHRAAALSALPAPRAAAAPRAALRRAPRASGPIGPADRAGLAERAAALSSHALGAAAALVLAAAPALAMGPLSGMGMGGMNMDMDDGMAPTASSPKEPKKPHTSAEWQTWAFSTAAPSYIAESATVIGVSEEGEANSVLREGSNGWTCLAGNPRPYPEGKGWASAHDAMPLCADEEGMKWITGYVNGEAPKMERDSIMYMLHGDMGEARVHARASASVWPHRRTSTSPGAPQS